MILLELNCFACCWFFLQMPSFAHNKRDFHNLNAILSVNDDEGANRMFSYSIYSPDFSLSSSRGSFCLNGWLIEVAPSCKLYREIVGPHLKYLKCQEISHILKLKTTLSCARCWWIHVKWANNVWRLKRVGRRI